MGPIASALWVAASFASSVLSNKNQSRVAQAQNNVQVEQARLQASEAAYERTKQFRQAVSMNLALAGMGVGGVSGIRGATAQNISDYFADTNAIGRQDAFAQLTGTSNKAGIKANSFTANVQAAGSAAQLANDLNLFKKKGK